MPLPDHTPLSLEALRAIAARHGIEAGARRVVPLRDWGIINAVYALGPRHVLRVPRDHPAHVDGLHREALAVPAARAAGVRAPELVAFDDGCALLPVPYAIYERVRGRALGALELEPPAAGDVWREFGRQLARLHAGVRSDGRAGLDMLPRGAAPGMSWGERPLARLIDALRFFLEGPAGPWGDVGPDRADAGHASPVPHGRASNVSARRGTYR